MDSLSIQQNNNRIAKNTLTLYFRMFLILIITFFSFRIVLNELGEEGYGTYNVVGGVVILFSFLSNALTQSTQRFLSYYLGKGDSQMLNKIYSTSINVHLLISLIILIIAETVGLWFLNTKMSFPSDLYEAVNWVYQCSIVAFIIQIMTVPFQAVIISHEKMSFYAYFSIMEVLLKLTAVVILYLFSENKLIIYAVSIVGVHMCVLLIYYLYCHKFFLICKYSAHIDKTSFKELTSFSAWNMLGGIGNVGATQGVNIIINIFCGVTLNAAIGVANQVGAAVSSFVSNLQTAFNPQIVKSYAGNDSERFYSLIFRSSRFSFLLIYTIGLPVVICCKTVLGLWLTKIPEYAVQFTQLMICFCMIDAISGSLWTAAQASGKIKVYMILIASLIITNVPVAYILLSMKTSPVWVIIYKVIINIIIHFIRITYLNRIIKFPSLKYYKKVMMPIIIYVICSVPLPLIIIEMVDSIIWHIGIMIIIGIECCVLGFYVLVTSHERAFIISRVKKYLAQIYIH